MARAAQLATLMALLLVAAQTSAQSGGGGAGGGGAGGAEHAGGGGAGGAPEVDADYDGYSVADGDCDDWNYAVYPGAFEYCNEIDDDCDGDVDEGLAVRRFVDADGDGWGRSFEPQWVCPTASGYADREGDCDDTNARIHPQANDGCDGRDDDCDGAIDEDCHDRYNSGAAPSANLVSGLLLAVWLGAGAWRRRKLVR